MHMLVVKLGESGRGLGRRVIVRCLTLSAPVLRCFRVQLWSVYQEGLFRIFSLVFKDEDVVRTNIRFLSDHRVLVEPACAAALQVRRLSVCC